MRSNLLYFSMQSEFTGQRPNFTALPNWLRGKTTPQELATLWALQSHFPNIYPSLSLLAAETGMSRRSVVNVLRALEDRGWMVRTRVRNESGGCDRNRYALTIWDPHWAVEVATPSALNALSPVHHVHHPSAGDAPPQCTTCTTPSAPRALKEEQFKKNKKRNLEKTPLCSPLSEDGAGADRRPAVSDTPVQNHYQPVEKPVENLVLDTFLISGTSFLNHESPERRPESPVAAQPQPHQPMTPWGQPRPLPGPSEPEEKKPRTTGRASKFQPSSTDIPANLLPVSEKIIEFWGNKAGEKTKQSWSYLIRELTKIQDYVSGGTDSVREQLQQGIDAKINGKGWRSITLNNFIRYGLVSQQKTGMRYGRKDVVEKVHETSQMIAILRAQQVQQEAEFFGNMSGVTSLKSAV
jgi:hypothetical protein